MLSPPKTLVLGASGLIGRQLAETLVAHGFPVRAAYRSRPVEIAGAEMVRIDAESGQGIADALAGMNQLFLLMGDVPDQSAIEIRIIEQARRAGLRHVVKLSTWGAETEIYSIARVHRPVEIAIAQSGLAFTLLRPNCFMQNFYSYYRNMIAHTGSVRLPCADAQVSFIDARDIAAVAAHVLMNVTWSGEAYELSGPEALSHDAATRLLATPNGGPVKYVAISDDECRAEMIAAGLAKSYAQDVVELCRFYRSGAAAAVTSAVEDITGRPAIPFARFAADHAGTWQ